MEAYVTDIVQNKKRQRVHEDKLVTLNNLKNVFVGNEDNNPQQCKIFSNGDVAEIFNDGNGIAIWFDAFSKRHRSLQEKLLINCASPIHALNLLDVRNVNGAREILSCSRDGRLSVYFVTTSANGNAVHHVTNFIELKDTERVSAVYMSDEMFIVGTTQGNTFVMFLTGDRSSLSGYHLHRTHFMLLGLFQTIDRMIRGTEDDLALQPVCRILEVPWEHNSILIGIGSTFTIWTNWKKVPSSFSSSARESHRDFNLRALLKEDVGADGCDNKDIVVLDCANIARSTESVDFFVLSIVRSEAGTQAGDALWLHVLQLVIPSASHAHTARLAITARLLITEMCDVHADSIAEDSSSFSMHPAILTPCSDTADTAATKDTTTAYIVWSEKRMGIERSLVHTDVSTTQASTTDCTAVSEATMRVLYLDACAVSLIEARRRERVRPPVEDTGLPTGNVLNAQSVSSIDGLSVVLRDGNVVKYMASLVNEASIFRSDHDEKTRSSPRKKLLGFDETGATASLKELGLAKHASDIEPSAIFQAVSVCAKEIDPAALKVVKVVFNRYDSVELGQMILSMCRGSVDQTPSGQHWGAATPGAASETEAARYQLAHRSTAEKVVKLTRIVHLLESTGTIRDTIAKEVANTQSSLLPSTRLSFDTQLNEDDIRELYSLHQRTLAAAGLSEAIHFGQQRIIRGEGSSTGTSGLAPKFDAISSARTPDNKESTFSTFDRNFGLLSVEFDRRQEDSDEFLSAANVAGLAMLRQGISIAIKELRRLNQEDFSSRGLSIVDVFFAQVSQISHGFLGAAMALELHDLDGYVNRVVLSDTAPPIFSASSSSSSLLSLPSSSFPSSRRQQQPQQSAQWLFTSCFGTLSLLLTALQKAAGLATSARVTSGVRGARRADCAVICDFKGGDAIRPAILKIVDLMRKTVQRINFDLTHGENVDAGTVAFVATEATPVQLKWAPREVSMEGVRLKALASIILQSYAMEEEREPDMTSEWKAKFQRAKETTIDLLLDLGHAHTAFSLSVDFMYFRGIFESGEVLKRLERSQSSGSDGVAGVRVVDFRMAHTGSSHLWQEAVNVVSGDKWRDFVGTDQRGRSLALFGMEWLEAAGRLADVLDLSRDLQHTTGGSNVLETFLQSRPHLSWLYFLGSHPSPTSLPSEAPTRYLEASRAAISHASAEPDAELSAAICSIAKLAAIVHHSDSMASKEIGQDSVGVSGTVSNQGRYSDYAPLRAFRRPSITVSTQGRRSGQPDALQLANTSLSILEAQRFVLQRKSIACEERGLKPGSRLGVDNLLHDLFSIADAAIEVADIDQAHTLDVADMAATLHMSLALISIVKDSKRAALQTNAWGGSGENDERVTDPAEEPDPLVLRVWACAVRASKSTLLDHASAFAASTVSLAAMGAASGEGDEAGFDDDPAALQDTVLFALMHAVQDQMRSGHISPSVAPFLQQQHQQQHRSHPTSGNNDKNRSSMALSPAMLPARGQGQFIEEVLQRSGILASAEASNAIDDALTTASCLVNVLIENGDMLRRRIEETVKNRIVHFFHVCIDLSSDAGIPVPVM